MEAHTAAMEAASSQSKRLSEGVARGGRGAEASSRFHRRTGIQQLCQVRRAGPCMFCGGKLSKGDWKFTFAQKVSKPEKSMHTTCLQAMDKEATQNSIAAVQAFLRQESLGEQEREICESALATLRACSMA